MNKRKGIDYDSPEKPVSSWEETKLCLQQTWDFDWSEQFQAALKHLSLDDERENLETEATAIQETLEDQIQDESEAFRAESDELYRIMEGIRELQADVANLEHTIEELRETELQVTEQIHELKKEASQEKEEIDMVELQRMQEVPKIKNQISLYAKTTGIRWDYQREDVLAGQVAVPSVGVINKFEIDPKEYDSFQVANYLWSVMDGETPTLIPAAS